MCNQIGFSKPLWATLDTPKNKKRILLLPSSSFFFAFFSAIKRKWENSWVSSVQDKLETYSGLSLFKKAAKLRWWYKRGKDIFHFVGLWDWWIIEKKNPSQKTHIASYCYYYTTTPTNNVASTFKRIPRSSLSEVTQKRKPLLLNVSFSEYNFVLKIKSDFKIPILS